MRPLLSLLLASLAACGPEADDGAPSTAGTFAEPAAPEAAPPAPVPEAAPAPIASGPTTYDCVSGETITLEETPDGLRYTLADRTVDLAADGVGRYATEAMWVEVADGRATVTRDEDATLDCTAR